MGHLLKTWQKVVTDETYLILVTVIIGFHLEEGDYRLHSASFRCAASLSQTIRQVAASRQKHTLPDLAYDYGALEPHISAEIMQLHHSKHHATYVNNLNITEEKYQEALAKGTDTVMPEIISE